MHHHHARTSTAARSHRRRAERGAGLVEYALLLALIAMVVLGAVAFFGTSNGGQFSRNADCIQRAYENSALCS